MIKFNAAPEFDFDEWSTLHQRDPEAFEARRRALLELGELGGQVRWRTKHDGEFGQGVGGAVHLGKMSWRPRLQDAICIRVLY
jgi:hypothetical protein